MTADDDRDDANPRPAPRTLQEREAQQRAERNRRVGADDIDEFMRRMWPEKYRPAKKGSK